MDYLDGNDGICLWMCDLVLSVVSTNQGYHDASCCPTITGLWESQIALTGEVLTGTESAVASCMLGFHVIYTCIYSYGPCA